MYFFCSWVMDWQNDILEKIKILFRGIGQVMFQNNAWSGVLMLAGIACNSLYMAGLALLGTVVSTSTARIAGYSCEDIRNGLYGFNGTLVGIAVGVFMNISVWAFMLLIIGAALSTWVMRLFQRQRFVPGYTAPFILVTWLLLLLERTVFPSLELSSDSVAVQEPVNIDFFQVFCLHIGQVMFQGGTVLSGLFFLVGIWINSRLNGLYAMWGAVLPLGAALFSGYGNPRCGSRIIGVQRGALCYRTRHGILKRFWRGDRGRAVKYGITNCRNAHRDNDADGSVCPCDVDRCSFEKSLVVNDKCHSCSGILSNVIFRLPDCEPDEGEMPRSGGGVE